MRRATTSICKQQPLWCLPGLPTKPGQRTKHPPSPPSAGRRAGQPDLGIKFVWPYNSPSLIEPEWPGVASALDAPAQWSAVVFCTLCAVLDFFISSDTMCTMCVSVGGGKFKGQRRRWVTAAKYAPAGTRTRALRGLRKMSVWGHWAAALVPGNLHACSTGSSSVAEGAGLAALAG